MDIRLKCEKPEEIEFTITATMKASEWMQIRDQLAERLHEWPTIKLVQAINDLLAQARKIYWPSEEGKRGES
jgi:hypothetical protein